MHIDYQDQTGILSNHQMDFIEKLLRFAATHESVQSNAELSVIFVDNQEIREINKNYRGKDQPTDVISFALQDTIDDVKMIGDHLPVILGDIIISVDQAKIQADDYNHSFERELGFLSIHGFLHLLGYDHMNDVDEKLMFDKQSKILGAFGLER